MLARCVVALVLPSIAADATQLATANRAKLARILQSLRSGGEAALCSPRIPFPESRRTVRWLHAPKCGSAFGNTVLHHGCRSLDGDLYLGGPSRGTAAEHVADREAVDPALDMPALARVAQRRCKRAHNFSLADARNVYLALTAWGSAPASRDLEVTLCLGRRNRPL